MTGNASGVLESLGNFCNQESGNPENLSATESSTVTERWAQS